MSMRPEGEPDVREDELVAVVAAMEDEVEPLRRRLRGVEEVRDGARRYSRALLRGVPVVVGVTGEGKRNADMVLRRMVQKCAPTRIVGVGFAGALSEGLTPMDLLVASEILEGDRLLQWPDLQWLREADLRIEHEEGRLVTVDEILSTREMKMQWWGKTERDQEAAADMESACWARVALSFRLPLLIARAITDSLEETLPPYLEDCRTQDGRLDRRQVFWKAFWRPATWPMLYKLRRRMPPCAERLADFVEAVVAPLAAV